LLSFSAAGLAGDQITPQMRVLVAIESAMGAAFHQP
jgi:hypothetical protein